MGSSSIPGSLSPTTSAVEGKVKYDHYFYLRVLRRFCALQRCSSTAPCHLRSVSTNHNTKRLDVQVWKGNLHRTWDTTKHETVVIKTPVRDETVEDVLREMQLLEELQGDKGFVQLKGFLNLERTDDGAPQDGIVLAHCNGGTLCNLYNKVRLNKVKITSDQMCGTPLPNMLWCVRYWLTFPLVPNPLCDVQVPKRRTAA